MQSIRRTDTSGRSANKFRKSSNNWLICGPSQNVTLCRFAICEPNLFVISGLLKTSASPQIHTFFPHKYCINALIKICSYIIKNREKNTTLSTVCAVLEEFWEFAICESIINICGFADCHMLRNLRIYDCGKSPRICGFANLWTSKKVAPLCIQIWTIVRRLEIISICFQCVGQLIEAE